MPAMKMHSDEVEIDASLVRRLIARQFPEWAGLPVERLESAGTENAMFRLGCDLVVRLPRHPGAVGGIAHEQRWLSLLGPRLPVAVPEPLGRGGADEEFPWPWSVFGWLDGRNPAVDALRSPETLARELAGFVRALRRVDAGGGPAHARAVPLSARDTDTRAALARLTGTADRVDTEAVTALWEKALRAPEHAGPPVWAHADLSPGNVLVTEGRLNAVIDFGCTGIGDPAVDLIVAWNLLPAGVRGTFREAVGADDAEWARGRGWALSISLIQLPYYRVTNPVLAANSRHVIREILAE
ncbi:aminoglycoside phosphotransferase family protein [Streptomyces sp. WI04-05B]|nr:MULTISPECIES: aminoglycoside phosphotransferase family protein [unclassified Streptomyces]MDX2548531.1 aminoglycoside phosphotransferase family protein [Streptomyces sp. WI04-05B]MDX2582609.1 aminoglycoside phosphotransferase family protein [Streptomyces sp. WI04-05A]MDX3747076.1 aminoglycoside phosphotransferase family protein [Streptomyces sp. AK08-02]